MLFAFTVFVISFHSEFTLTMSISLPTSAPVVFNPNNVSHFVSFTLMTPITLPTSTPVELSSYRLALTWSVVLTRSAVLFPSPRQGLPSYS